MALPKHKTTSSKTRRRRSHHALKKQNLAECKGCGAKKRPHTACPECGSVK